MRDRLKIFNNVIFACSKQWQGVGVDWCDSLKQNAVENLWWKHGVSQNARSEHEQPESIVKVIGSAVGVSVNTEVWPTKLNTAALEFSPGSTSRPMNSSRCAQVIAHMEGVNRGHPASKVAREVGNNHGIGVPVGGGCI